MITPRFSIRMLFLGGYIVSLMFSSVQIQTGWSLPFVAAAALFTYKLLEMWVSRRFLFLKPEMLLIVALYLYLLAAERLLHNGTIVNSYFIPFGLNVIVMILIADEFYRNSAVREYIMRVYVAAAVVVGLLMSLGIATKMSSSGRMSFMMQNENELAAALLIAYVYLSREFVHISWSRISMPLIVLLSSSALLLNAIISTGTRFAMVAVFMVVSLLTIFTLINRERVRSGVIYLAFTLMFIALKVISPPLFFVNPTSSSGLSPEVSGGMSPEVSGGMSPEVSGGMSPEVNRDNILISRWSPEGSGNNLSELGGRLQKWQTSLDAFMQSPFIGLGHHNYQQLINTQDRVLMNPHNFLLEIAAISGVLGLIFIVKLMLVFFSRISVLGCRVKFQYVLIWSVPVAVIAMMMGVVTLKVFWFLLAYYLTFSCGDGKEARMELR